MGPRRQIRKDLRLATALLSPEESSTEVALEAIIGDASDILGSPVMITELVVALQI